MVKMKADEKQSVMWPLRTINYNTGIATTVIEVGVDVPNASIMVIENAERLGLSQLHQLRGRGGSGQPQVFAPCSIKLHCPKWTGTTFHFTESNDESL